MGEMYWLCGGVLLGGFFQMAVPAVVLMREGWRPRLDFAPSPRVREIALLMAPGLFGTAIYQINIFVSRSLAFSLNDSAVAIMFYANRLMEFPIGVFAIAVMTVVYPLLARHAAEKNFNAMAEDFRKGIRLILAINVPAAAGLMLLSTPISQLLYQHGNFTADATASMAQLLMLFAIGLPFFSVVSLTVRAFYALKDTKTPVKIATIDFMVNIALSLVLMRWFAERGLVLASTSAIIVQAVLLQRALVRRVPGMTLKPLWPSFVKVLLGTIAMAGVVLGGWHLLVKLHPGARLNNWIAVLGLIPLGVMVYGGMLWLLKIEGREEFATLFDRFRARRGEAASRVS
jgi:putative peptidoglycan lipid II flippase